ncbi:MAG: hypothetical protein VKN60_06440 [Cyanobacteriota bacterium]|nr:hypothetical protein [Cyanobacteriota bacterium]
MELSAQGNLGGMQTLTALKSFSVWTVTLAVCGLVVGFPLVVLMATLGVLATLVLQFVLPLSAVVLVTGLLLGGNALAVLLGAALLTLKGVRPQDVSWLSWLQEDNRPSHQSVFAACPLTCELVL